MKLPQEHEHWVDEFADSVGASLAPRVPGFRGQLRGAIEPQAYSTIAPERFDGARHYERKVNR